MPTTSLGIDNSKPAIGIETDVDRLRLHRELVHAFAHRQGIGAAVTVAVTLTVVGVLWAQMPTVVLLLWAGAQVILGLSSWLRWRPFADRDALERLAVPSAREAVLWKLASGVLWGLTAIAGHAYFAAPFDTFTFLIIAGMAAGATSTLSALRGAGVAFIIGILVPAAIACALAGTLVYYALAVLALMFMVSMIGTVRVNHAAIRSVISERIGNENMQDNFQAERDSWLEVSNTTEAFAIFDENDELIAWNVQFGDLMLVPVDLLQRGTARAALIRNARKPIEFAIGPEKIGEWIAYSNQVEADWTVTEYEGGVWIRRRITQTRGNHLAISFVDVTDMKRAEQAMLESEGRFRAIVENLPGGIVLKDRDMRIVLATGKIYGRVHELLGADAVGKSIFDLIDAESAAQVDLLDRYVLDTGLMTEGLQSFPGADGKAVDFWNIRFPIEDENGEISGVGVLTQDVSEQRLIEAQLQQSQKMEMVGQLTGGIAHDFNNLLTVVFGNAGLLADHVSDDPVAEDLLRNLSRAAERGGDLTQRLLAFSRRQNLQPVVVDVRETIANAIGLLERTIEETITLDVDVSSDLPLALIDPVQLESALVNLAVNSRDAMPDGGTITFEAREMVVGPVEDGADAPLAPGRYIELSVRDNGVGMALGVAEHIFEPFFTTKETGKGTGLGLSMVYGFARQSDGDVVVSSVEWGGTTITLYLPVAAEENVAESDKAQAEPTVSRGGDEKVFVIEDDEDVLAFVEASLESKGYTVVTAIHGVAALDSLNEGLDFDLVLSDVVLPRGVSGPEVARQVRSRHPNIPVLFMSGYTGDALEDTGWPEIGYDLIQKPFTRETLFARVRESLDQAMVAREQEADPNA